MLDQFCKNLKINNFDFIGIDQKWIAQTLRRKDDFLYMQSLTFYITIIL